MTNRINEIMQEIQDVNFKRVYCGVHFEEELGLLNRSRVLKAELKRLENGRG